MGLAVVGRLADRYEIKVEMRPNPDGGIITQVTLPSSILILPRLRGREPVVTRPRSPLAVERGPVGAPPPNPPGWPMPQLPGLAGAGSPAMTGGGVGTATLSGWAELAEARQDWTPVNQPIAPTVATPTISAPPAPATSTPTAGNGSLVDALGAIANSQPRTGSDETAELPIFRAMEAVWFRSHGHSATGNWPTVGPNGEAGQNGGAAMANGSTYVAPQPSMAAPPPPPPVAQPPMAPPVVPPAYVPPEAPPPPPTSQTSPPRQYQPAGPAGPGAPAGEESWRTVADDGWRAAAAAAEPAASGTTRSGLPKRVPAAQLVPGGVDPRASVAKNRRTPDEVRGLLSAYHRGVQRGRSGADGGPGNAQRPTDEERH
jgi:hypothetical protein